MRHETTVTIDAPVDTVWDTIAAVGRWSEWTPTVTSGQRLDDGPLRVGSTARMVQPRQPVRTWTVTRVEPGRSFCWRTGNAALHMVAGHVLSTVDGQVSVLLTFELSGPVAPLAALVAGRTIREFVETEGRSLKAWCESADRHDAQPRG